eukprot:gene18154-19965_t
MALKAFCLVTFFSCCFLTFISGNKVEQKACSLKRTSGIPDCHIYHEKRKPFVLGHRGNPIWYQENSFDGFRSLRRAGADGFEVDVFLTKDKQLVCFHDYNTMRLTGVNRNIIDMTRCEIEKLRYKKVIKYGKKTYRYNRRRRVVFLDDLLHWAKKTNLLVYIEMKPSSGMHKNKASMMHAMATGKAVANIVKAFGMASQVIVGGYDVLKTSTAKKMNKHLVIGTSYHSYCWKFPNAKAHRIKQQLIAALPSIAPCLKPIANTTNKIADYLFLSGVIAKAVGASIANVNLVMFDNAKYGTNQTIQTLKTNYNYDLALGVYTLYSMSDSAATVSKIFERILDRQIIEYITPYLSVLLCGFRKAFEPKIDSLIKQRVDFFFVDDVKRLMEKIDRHRCKCMKARSHSQYDDDDDDDDLEQTDRQ